MATFLGYLLKSGNDIFPHEYIQLESWESTPNQREEIKAYRDDNTRNLVRVTAAGRKTVISFKTRDGLNKAQKEEIIDFFTSHETNAAERKIPITYWNDEDAQYKTGDFYRPNMKFPISQILTIYDRNSLRPRYDIRYGELQIELVEY